MTTALAVGALALLFAATAVIRLRVASCGGDSCSKSGTAAACAGCPHTAADGAANDGVGVES
jgi:hypothetical protein